MSNSKHADYAASATGGIPRATRIGRSQPAKPSPDFKEIERTEASAEEQKEAVSSKKVKASRKDQDAPVNQQYAENDDGQDNENASDSEDSRDAD